MARFIECGMRSAECGILLLVTALFAACVRADDVKTLAASPKLAPYQWFASTDPKGQNADYLPLKPGETRRIPLAAGVLLRLWSTASEPENIVLRLHNGQQRVDLLRDGKALSGTYHEKALTFYPTTSTPARARVLSKDSALVATNLSKQENKWFYQVTVRDDGTVPEAAIAPEKKVVERIDWEELDEHIRAPAQQGKELFAEGIPKNLQLCIAYGSVRSEKGKPIPILQVTGEGAFVGLVLDIRPAPDTTRRTFAYLEGNEIITADDKTYEGTGTEDFFNSAWYYPDEPFSFPYHGMTFKGLEPPRVTTYRWMVPDAVPFKKEFRFDLEHGNGNNSSDLEYRWVAFWYQKEPVEYEVPDELTGQNAQAASEQGNRVVPWVVAVAAVVGMAVVFFILRSRYKSRSL